MGFAMVFYRLRVEDEGLFGHGSTLAGHSLTDGVDEDDSEDGESCEDDQGELEVFLELTPDVNGIETALLETGSAVFMMVVVMMFGH
jgi:hypothetical protein